MRLSRPTPRDPASWRVAGTVAIAVLLMLFLAACGSGAGTQRAKPGAKPTHVAYYVSAYGVRMGIEVGFPQDRTVTGATLRVGQVTSTVPLYPEDGSDPDVPPKRLHLRVGQRVLLEGEVLKGCPETSAVPEFQVSTETDGKRTVIRYTPDDVGKFRTAFATWCRRGVTMTGVNSSVSPGGDITLSIAFSNPGPDPATVVSEAFSRRRTHWELARGEIAPGSVGSLTVHGHGPHGCGGPTPWQSRHLLADGRPVTPDDYAAQGC